MKSSASLYIGVSEGGEYNLGPVEEGVEVLHWGVGEAVPCDEDEQEGSEDGEVERAAHHEAHFDLHVAPRSVELLDIHGGEDHVL